MKNPFQTIVTSLALLIFSLGMSSSQTTPYPIGAVPVGASGSGSTGAVAGVLPAVQGRLNYICGWSVSAIGGTGAVGPITLSGGSVIFTYQASSAAAGFNLQQNYSPCLPAAAPNTPIQLLTTADGTATAVNVNVWGYHF